MSKKKYSLYGLEDLDHCGWGCVANVPVSPPWTTLAHPLVVVDDAGVHNLTSAPGAAVYLGIHGIHGMCESLSTTSTLLSLLLSSLPCHLSPRPCQCSPRTCCLSTCCCTAWPDGFWLLQLARIWEKSCPLLNGICQCGWRGGVAAFFFL